MSNLNGISKEILFELKKIADKIGISLKDLIFGDNILILKNESKKENLKKEMLDNQIRMKTKVEDGVMKAIINIPDGYEVDTPIHFCFILDKKGTRQVIQPIWHIGKYTKVKIFSYCFGLDFDVFHKDGKDYYLEEGAEVEVYDFNYNKNDSYLTVYNNVYVEIKDNAKFKNYYISTVGHLGHSVSKCLIKCTGRNSKVDFVVKSKILNKDISELDIKIELIGENSSGLLLSKSVTYKGGINNFKGELVGIGDNTKGHIECDEVSMGKSIINSSPILCVRNPTSRLTHEASIGTVEKKVIDNLMVKGLNYDEAIDFIVKGILD